MSKSPSSLFKSVSDAKALNSDSLFIKRKSEIRIRASLNDVFRFRIKVLRLSCAMINDNSLELIKCFFFFR